jgi:hypothetical protein
MSGGTTQATFSQNYATFQHTELIFEGPFMCLCFFFLFSAQQSQAQIYTSNWPRGGNPFPQFCNEPCETILTRWFAVEIHIGAIDVTVQDFDLQTVYFQPTMNGVSIPGSQPQPLTIVAVNLLETSGTFPHGFYRDCIHIPGSGFQDFPHDVQAHTTATFHFEVQMIGCHGASGQTMPDGLYYLDYEIYTSTGRVPQETTPIHTCSTAVVTPNPPIRPTPVLVQGPGPGGEESLFGSRLSTTTQATAISLKASPNPFHDRVAFSAELTDESLCSLSLYNLQGRKLKTLMQGRQLPAGTHQLAFELGNLAPGMYFAQLETPTDVETLRIVKK